MPMDLPRITLPDAAAWRHWLAQNHARPKGVLITLVKAGMTTPTSLTYPQALDEALCYGWIDSGGHKRPEFPGAQYFRFTPRKPNSLWSKRNVGYVQRLIDRGKMQQPGLAAVEAAKADGRWDSAYAGSATAEPPADFMEALEDEPKAKAAWESLNRGNRWFIYFRLLNLKTQTARERNIATFVNMLARGETPLKEKRSTKVIRKSTGPDSSRPKSFTSPSVEAAASTRQTRSGRTIPQYGER